jgi:hypothetical protein
MTKSGFVIYQSFMADWAASAIAPHGEVLEGDERTAKDLQIIDDIFKRFTEITETVENLDLCLSFLSGRPPRRNGLRLDAFLNYHITFYLQEIYILNERLDAYLKVLQRRKKKLGEVIDDVKYSYWIARVRSALKNIIDVRGAHVHARAFNDSRMKELGSYSFLAIHAPEKAIWEKLAKKEYAKIRRIWVTALRKTNSICKRSWMNILSSFIQKFLLAHWLPRLYPNGVSDCPSAALLDPNSLSCCPIQNGGTKGSVHQLRSTSRRQQSGRPWRCQSSTIGSARPRAPVEAGGNILEKHLD